MLLSTHHGGTPLGLDNHWHLWLPYAPFREMALVAEAQGQAKQWPKGQGVFNKRKWFAGLGVFFPSKISTYHFFHIQKLKKTHLYKRMMTNSIYSYFKSHHQTFLGPRNVCVLFGDQQKKRANQPSQPARLVTETTQGLPGPATETSLVSTWRHRFHRRDTGSQQPQ